MGHCHKVINERSRNRKEMLINDICFYSNSVFLRKAELNLFKEEEPPTIIAEEGNPFKLQCNPPDGWPKPKVYWMLQVKMHFLIANYF
jgi:hypothetical protein